MNTTTSRPPLVRAAVAAGALSILTAACAADGTEPADATDTDDESTESIEQPTESAEVDETTERPSDTGANATNIAGDDTTGDDTTGDDTTGPEATESGAGRPNDPATNPIGFEDCGDGVECAMFEVPLDYDDPAGETVEVHVTRRPAAGDRIGTLFVNPGGPGFGAEDMVRGLGQFGPPPLTQAFDLVGVDPRGTGRSGAIDCNTDDDADMRRDLSFDPTDLDAYIADFEDLAATCESSYDLDYLASITTVNAARDMESVRIALGDEPLNYYGASYGTAIGSVYATMYPDSIRTMVLDAAVPTDPPDGTFESIAPDIEQALVRLDTSCELWSECAVRDVGLIAAIDQVRATLERDGNIGNLNAANFNAAIALLLPVPIAMADVADGLAQALDGNGSMLAQIGDAEIQQLRLPDSDALAVYSGARQAITCADGWNLENSTVDELAGQLERTLAQAPNAGPGWEMPCDLWPVTGPGIPAASYTGDAPILVIGGEGDPITPLRWSEDLADDLGPNATLLVSEDTGHTSAFRRQRCIDSHVFALLFEEVLPEDGARCAARGMAGFAHPGSVVVQTVWPGSPAEAAGLQVGDRMIEADGRPVETPNDVQGGDIGQPLDLVVERDDETIELTIVRGPAFHELWRLAEASDD